MVKKKKIFGYCRVSTLEQKKRGYGINIQEKEIVDFARDNALELDHIYKDEAVSGTQENRMGLDRLRELCSKGEVKAVIFPSTDRMARSVRVSENLYYELSKANVKIYFADMPYYDPGDYNHVMMRQIREVISEGNRNAIVDRLKKGRIERVRKGRPPGGNTPYGYRRANKAFVKDSAEAEVVKEAFRFKGKGFIDRDIADKLNRQGFKRRNGKAWTQRQVNAILSRAELYQKGVLKYGENSGRNKKLIIVESL